MLFFRLVVKTGLNALNVCTPLVQYYSDKTFFGRYFNCKKYFEYFICELCSNPSPTKSYHCDQEQILVTKFMQAII